MRKQGLPKPHPKQISYRSMKKFDTGSIICDLENVWWERACIFENLDDIWSNWKGLYNEVLDLHAPVKKIWVQGDQLPWITLEINLNISHCCQLYGPFCKKCSPKNWDAFKRKGNMVTSLKRKVLHGYFVSANSNHSSPRQFWRKLRPLLPNMCGSHSDKIAVIENGQVHNKPWYVAEIFKNYFPKFSLSHSFTRTESEFNKHTSINLINKIVKDQIKSSPFSFQAVSVKYVLDLLLHLNGSKATSVDGIPQRLLKASAPALMAPMTRSGPLPWTDPLLPYQLQATSQNREHLFKLMCTPVWCPARISSGTLFV